MSPRAARMASVGATCGRRHRRDPGEVDAERGDGPEAVGAQQRAVPRDRSAPVVAHDDRGVDPARVEQADDVADQVELGVLVDARGHVGGAVAPLVGCEHVVPGVAQHAAAGGATSTSTRGSRGTARRQVRRRARLRRRACECRWCRRAGGGSCQCSVLGPVEIGRRVVGEVGAAERGGVGQRQVHVGLLLEAERQLSARGSRARDRRR